jgi:N-acetylglucosaminyldiphosphoundecaprenol N-acetyl-beta-D-mannosaminyltransferase
LVDQAQALDILRARDPQDGFAFVMTPNAANVVRVQKGSRYDRLGYERAMLTTCDSRVLAGLARVLFGWHFPVVTGSDLTRTLLTSVIDPDEPVTVIGGDAALMAQLQRQFGLTKLALFDPPYGFYNHDDQLDEAAAFVEAHPARFIFLCCGAPQSEQLALRIQDRGRTTGIGLCVGNSLRFATGQVPRAPELLRKAGLDWLHRLAVEPRRLWWRFVSQQLPILVLALRFRIQPSLAADHSRRDLWH